MAWLDVLAFAAMLVLLVMIARRAGGLPETATPWVVTGSVVGIAFIAVGMFITGRLNVGMGIALLVGAVTVYALLTVTVVLRRRPRPNPNQDR